MEEAEKKGLLDFLARLTRPLAEAIGKRTSSTIVRKPRTASCYVPLPSFSERKQGMSLDPFASTMTFRN